jgi:hypothetical protein
LYFRYVVPCLTITFAECGFGFAFGFGLAFGDAGAAGEAGAAAGVGAAAAGVAVVVDDVSGLPGEDGVPGV